MCKIKDNKKTKSVADTLWEAVSKNDIKEVYRYIVSSDVVNINSISHEQVPVGTLAETVLLSQGGIDHQKRQLEENDEKKEEEMRQISDHHCSLFHLACQTADIAIVELLLQFGANINACDSKGRTPLHHAIISRRPATAKLLLARFCCFYIS